MAIITSGISAELAKVLDTGVVEGLQAAISAVTNIQAPKISLQRPIAVEGEGIMARKFPKRMLFPFAPPTAQPDDLSSTGRSFNPLVRNATEVQIKPYGVGYNVDRTDFFNDIYGTLANVPRNIARPMMKLPDILLAALLRNGKTITDYTGTFAFSAAKPKSVNGAISGTYSNLYTGRQLTAQNLSFVISEMMARVNEDGLNLGLMPDTLIVPPNLYGAAIQAVEMRNNVYSGTAGAGNLWPGQANSTAAVGDNWIAHTGFIKQIISLPELTQGGASIDTTSWYVAECMNADHGGAVGLLCALEEGFEFLSNLSPDSPEVFYNNRFAWAGQRYAGVGFGLTQYLSRCES